MSKKQKKKQPKPQLSEDVISEILSWLPVSSILKFKSASKSWLYLITDCIQNPSFVDTHLHRSKKNQHDPTIVFYLCNGTLCPVHLTVTDHGSTLLGEYGNGSSSSETQAPNRNRTRTLYSITDAYNIVEMVYPVDPQDCHNNAGGDEEAIRDFYIFSSCNGLLVITLRGDIYLWNPCTQEIKQIPEPPPFEWLKSRRKHLFSTCEYGLVYDDILGDYKIVMYVLVFRKNIDTGDGVLNCEVLVYTLGTNSWRWIDQEPCKLPYHCRPFSKKKQVYVNGAHHWVVVDGSSHGIISFDTKAEKYRMVPKPAFYDRHLGLSHLDVLRGCLCLIDYGSYNYHGRPLNVWVMKEYGVQESWTKLCSTVQLGLPNDLHFFKILWSYENGDILIEKDTRDIFLFDPQKDKAKLLCSAVPYPWKSWYNTEAYIGSFVSLKSDNCLPIRNQGKREEEEEGK